MTIKKEEFDLLELDAKVNRKTDKEYVGKFETRCRDNKVGNKLTKMTDEEIEIFYKIISAKKGTLRSALTNYFKSLGIRRDLPNYLVTKEAVDRNILNVEE